MTESAGGNAPEEQASQEPAKSVTIQDLCEAWDLPANSAGELQKFMGQDGPWTPEEAAELDRRMSSLAPEDRFPGFTGEPQVWAIPQGQGTNGQGVDGPHGPGCECGDLTPEEQAQVEELMGVLAPALAEALGIGRTPAEERTGVSDPEAAIMGELKAIRAAAQEYGKFTGRLGVATARLRDNPLRAIPAMQEATNQASEAVQRLEEGLARIGSWLPQVRGRRATLNGEPMYVNEDGTEIRAAKEVPSGEGWRPLFVR